MPPSEAEVRRVLGRLELGGVPGVLGELCRQRFTDYSGQPAAEWPAPRPLGRLRDALGGAELSVLAEVKRASPSQGPIRASAVAAETALAYASAGAAAISVLTEPTRFRGRLSDLLEVSAALPDYPVLRKDFIVHPRMLIEAAWAGASAALLIAAALGESLSAFLDWARELGLDALVEVHDQGELQRAMDSGAEIIGINNRDLATLSVDRSTAPQLARLARSAGFRGILVAESGYQAGSELADLTGIDAVLVGSSLMANADPGAALKRFLDESKLPGRSAH